MHLPEVCFLSLAVQTSAFSSRRKTSPSEFVKNFLKDLRIYRDYFFEDLVWHPVDPRRRICLKPSTRSLQFLKSEERFAQEHAGTSVLSLE